MNKRWIYALGVVVGVFLILQWLALSSLFCFLETCADPGTAVIFAAMIMSLIDAAAFIVMSLVAVPVALLWWAYKLIVQYRTKTE